MVRGRMTPGKEEGYVWLDYDNDPCQKYGFTYSKKMVFQRSSELQ